MNRSPALVLSWVLTTLLLAACASTGPDRGSAWDRYIEFEQALVKEGLKLNYEPYFSENAYRDIQEARPEDVIYIKEMLAYPLYFSETFSHAEKHDKARQCLVINGKLTGGELASLAVEFIHEDKMKMNDANLIFVESEDGLLETALCPDETRV